MKLGKKSLIRRSPKPISIVSVACSILSVIFWRSKILYDKKRAPKVEQYIFKVEKMEVCQRPRIKSFCLIEDVASQVFLRQIRLRNFRMNDCIANFYFARKLDVGINFNF